MGGLPLFFPNPLSVQLSFKGLQITILFPLTSQRDAYARCLFKASKNISVFSEGATVQDLRSSMGTAVYKFGFLCKRGEIVKNWKMRFFVLRPGDLSYFETKDDALHGETPLNIFYLRGAVIEKAPYSKYNKSCAIEINFAASSGNSDRMLILEASDDAECDDWVQVMRGSLLLLCDIQLRRVAAGFDVAPRYGQRQVLSCCPAYSTPPQNRISVTSHAGQGSWSWMTSTRLLEKAAALSPSQTSSCKAY
jgi:hypothetical protein